jgi:alkylation response protein AidB-like acyl-CoA dehydrogenase
MRTPISFSPIAPSGPPGASDFPIESYAPVDVAAALEFAARWGHRFPLPGSGSTATLWEHLATFARHDLGSARAIEPHLDALAILDQAGDTELPDVARDPSCTWGVFAAEGDPVLRARQTDDGWVLSGIKPWCSLADRLTAALVTATLDDGRRALFAVDLGHPGVHTENEGWTARGLIEIPSGAVEFTDVPSFSVREPEWYLTRPGFAWGGIGVAACWYGGAVGLARTLFEAARRPDPDRLLLMHLGAVDEGMQSARRALAEAARAIDEGRATGEPARVIAKQVRATVARVAEDVMRRAGHALGPAPLAKDAVHAKRVADLTLYLRQHHAERDEASLGEALARQENPPW